MKTRIEVNKALYNAIEDEIDFLNIKITKCQAIGNIFLVDLSFKETQCIQDLRRQIGKDFTLRSKMLERLALPREDNIPIKRAKGNLVIYGIYDPTNRKLKYVGRTKDFYARKRQHLRSLSDNKISKWIHAKKKIGKTPYFKLLKSCNE